MKWFQVFQVERGVVESYKLASWRIWVLLKLDFAISEWKVGFQKSYFYTLSFMEQEPKPLLPEDAPYRGWIYKLQNNYTSRCYVGQTVNLARRLNDHIVAAMGTKKTDRRLQCNT